MPKSLFERRPRCRRRTHTLTKGLTVISGATAPESKTIVLAEGALRRSLDDEPGRCARRMAVPRSTRAIRHTYQTAGQVRVLPSICWPRAYSLVVSVNLSHNDQIVRS